MSSPTAKMLSQTLYRLGWGTALSITMIAVLLHLVARAGSEVNLSMVYQGLTSLPLFLLTSYTLIMLLNTLLRTFRYRLLLKRGSDFRELKLLPLFLVTGVRNMVVDLLPARTGELLFVTMVSRFCGVPVPAGVATLVISTLLDVFVLLPVLLLIFLLPFTNETFRGGSLPAALVIAIFVLVGVIVLLPGLRVFVAWSRQIKGRNRLLNWAWKFLSEFSDAIARCREQSILGTALMLTFGIRLLKYGGLLLLFRGLAEASAITSDVVGVADMLVALIASEVGASLPFPTFMSFGAYEVGGAAALVLLGYTLAAAVVLLLTLHIATQVLDYSFGSLCLLCLIVLRGRGERLIESSVVRASKSRKVFNFGLVVLSLGGAIALAVSQTFQVRAVRSAVAPQIAEDNRDVTGVSESPEQGIGLNGWIVWSSNRFGNHDLLKMDLKNGSIKKLTDHPHVDTYARVSPDGKKIVFSRSRKPWVSLRDYVNWDAYVLDLETGREELLAEYATAPTWSLDGSHIYFHRKGKLFIEVDISKNTEKVLYRAGFGQIPSDIKFQEPSLGPVSGSLATTFRGSKRMTAIVDPQGAVLPVGNGCQVAWSPREDYVYWVDDGGLMKNQIYRKAPGDSGREAWLDLPEPFSHEYFPRVSANGEFLVLGSSAGGHEHDVADYEIFLWRIGSPAAEAKRLTFNKANDNWPDIFIESR